jgi:NAD(P)-dependent dehydrogenase (short-subunit alcohol dehydrogenase family)
VIFVEGDAADPATATRLAAEASSRFGRIDYVVPAAGGPNPGKVTDLSAAQWMEAFAIHVHAVFHLFRACHPLLAVRGGGVLMIGSVAGKRGCPSTIAYQTVKGALPQMARALARDHGHEGIRVNVIEPGIIRTRFHAAMTPEAERNNLDNRIPLRRFGTPENVAEAALTLLTNPFITGETLVIDGGMSMRMV